MTNHPHHWTDTHRLVATQVATVATPQHPLPLESGAELKHVQLAYETYGELNATKSNAILIFHALTADAHVAGKHHEHDPKTGWWDALFGEGLAFNPATDFIICANVLGGCKGSTGASSINPETGTPWGMTFPLITVGDMVVAQKRLLEQLGVGKLKAVVGGSMGGFQAMDFALRYPESVERVVLVATSSKLSSQAIAFNAVARYAILNDPNWNEGNYSLENQPTVGLSTARMMAHITYLSEEALEAKFGRRLQAPAQGKTFDFQKEFAVESYLEHQGKAFLKRFDANTYLYLTKVLDYFDLAEAWGEGSLLKAFSRTQAKFLIASFSSDWRFPTACSQAIAKTLRQLGREVSFIELSSTAGHDAFLLETEALNRIIAPFLHPIDEGKPTP